MTVPTPLRECGNQNLLKPRERETKTADVKLLRQVVGLARIHGHQTNETRKRKTSSVTGFLQPTCEFYPPHS
jgi:hypothetical protein